MKKCLSIILSLLLLFFSFTIYSSASEGQVFSVLSFEVQQKSYWCWVTAAINSVHHERDTVRSQYATVYHIKGTVTNWYPNVTGNISDIETAAEYASYNTESYTGTNTTKTYNTLKLQIKKHDNATILCAGVYDSNNNRTDGHAVTMTGYAINSNGNYIQYFDPWDGQSFICTYTSFCNGSFNGRRYDQTCMNTEVIN